jgi:transposase
LLKAFAKRHKKNDKIDSALIARLLAQGHLPTIAHAPLADRQRRDLYRQRMELVHRRTGAACRAKAFADRLGWQAEMNLSTRKGIHALAALPVEPPHQFILASHVRWLTFQYDEIKCLQKIIDATADRTPDAKRLMTIHGIGPYLGLLIASEVFDVTRFPNSRCFASYAGVAPGSLSSAGKRLGGRLPSGVNKYLIPALGFHRGRLSLYEQVCVGKAQIRPPRPRQRLEDGTPGHRATRGHRGLSRVAGRSIVPIQAAVTAWRPERGTGSL